jgi:hypothetical protein
MARNTKVLYLSLALLCGFCAAWSSPASGARFDSTTDGTFTVSGSQATAHKFTTDPGTLTCKSITYHGISSGTGNPWFTLTPSYKECTLATIFGSIMVEVVFGECHFDPFSYGAVNISCPAGKGPVLIAGPGCTIKVPAQLIETFDYVNSGSGVSADVTMHGTASGIEYSYSGFTCGSGSGTKNGSYTGSTTLKASFAGSSVGLTHTTP